jgi:hypothetical protein
MRHACIHDQLCFIFQFNAYLTDGPCLLRSSHSGYEMLFDQSNCKPRAVQAMCEPLSPIMNLSFANVLVTI